MIKNNEKDCNKTPIMRTMPLQNGEMSIQKALNLSQMLTNKTRQQTLSSSATPQNLHKTKLIHEVSRNYHGT